MVTKEEALSLYALIKLEEIEQILKTFKNDKSLGPDGWPIEFYLGFHDFLEEELIRVT